MQPAARRQGSSFGSLRDPTSLLDMFDLKFEKYLTPWIVRATWVLVLTVAALWIAKSMFDVVVASLPEVDTATKSTESVTDIEPPSSTSNEAPSLSFESLEWLDEVLEGIWQCAQVILGVLWLRVCLETVIVLFNIAKSAKTVEKHFSNNEP